MIWSSYKPILVSVVNVNEGWYWNKKGGIHNSNHNNNVVGGATTATTIIMIILSVEVIETHSHGNSWFVKPVKMGGWCPKRDNSVPKQPTTMIPPPQQLPPTLPDVPFVTFRWWRSPVGMDMKGMGTTFVPIVIPTLLPIMVGLVVEGTFHVFPVPIPPVHWQVVLQVETSKYTPVPFVVKDIFKAGRSFWRRIVGGIPYPVPIIHPYIGVPILYGYPVPVRVSQSRRTRRLFVHTVRRMDRYGRYRLFGRRGVSHPILVVNQQHASDVILDSDRTSKSNYLKWIQWWWWHRRTTTTTTAGLATATIGRNNSDSNNNNNIMGMGIGLLLLLVVIGVGHHRHHHPTTATTIDQPIIITA
jgi:hypothetical protein